MYSYSFLPTDVQRCMKLNNSPGFNGGAYYCYHRCKYDMWSTQKQAMCGMYYTLNIMGENTFIDAEHFCKPIVLLN